MQVGFSVLTQDEQVEFHFYGQRPGAPRSLTAYVQEGDLHAVLMGRFTYRSELLDQLGRRTASQNLASDVELALAVYRQWGADGLARLEGTFALVLWDAAKKLLFGVRDPLGGYPLFWTKHQGGLAFGTCMGPLLQQLPRRSLNLDYLADYLAVPGSWVNEVATDQCAYQGIQRVLPGSVLLAQIADGQIRQQGRWDWLEHLVDPGTDRLEELGLLVEERLRQAVRQQLRGCVAAHVSGGMDSTALALLARDELRTAPGQPPVHAISAVFERLGGLARETPYLECALRQPGIAAHRVRCDDILDFDCFVDPPFHDEPNPGLNALSMVGKLAEAAATAGADTLFTGEGADALLDLRPHHLADLLRRGRLWSAWRDARTWGRATNASAWLYLREFGLAHLWPTRWRGGYASWDRQGPGTIPTWIRPAFARTHGLRERRLASLRQESSSGLPMNLSVVLSMLRATRGDCCSWSVAAPRGLTVVHPFLDPRHVSLCLGIQTRYRQEPGSQKPLLAQAMRAVLPDLIRNRPNKGHFNGLAFGGLIRNLPVLETLVRSTAVEDLGLFDREALLQCLQLAALGSASADALSQLHVTLSWLRWYSMQREWQRPMTPIAIVRPSHPGQPTFRSPNNMASRER